MIDFSALFTSVLASLVSALIIGLILVYVLRVPSLELQAYARLNAKGLGSIFFELRNKKSLMNYEPNQITYHIYLPVDLFPPNGKYELKIQTIEGWAPWNALDNYEVKDRFPIDGQVYIVVRAVCHLRACNKTLKLV